MSAYDEIILLKCGEIVLKGLNRHTFEAKLISNVRRRLRSLGDFDVFSAQSTVYVRPRGGADIDAALDAVSRVFGIVSISKSAVCEKDIQKILPLCESYLSDELLRVKTFRVECRRSDKTFPLTSPALAAEAGGYLLEKYPHLTVDLHNPELTVNIEIRDFGAHVHGGRLPGAGGIPVGTGGRGVLLLSGGIDSPVAGYMMAKRGVSLELVHFASPPYTSELARKKVESLASVLSSYAGEMTLHIVPFTFIQDEIRKNCPEELFTLVMRRFMMRISGEIAARVGAGALITGESLGQVASQTMESLAVTNSVCVLPVLRPLIGMDKEEIVKISRKMGAFETSILPYEDCCTVFTPKHPKTKPREDQLTTAEQKLDIPALVKTALESAERVRITSKDF